MAPARMAVFGGRVEPPMDEFVLGGGEPVDIAVAKTDDGSTDGDEVPGDEGEAGSITAPSDVALNCSAVSLQQLFVSPMARQQKAPISQA